MDKMYNGLKINVWKLGDAGGYNLEVVEMYTVTIKLELGLGQPYKSALKHAERLAVAIDAELNVNSVTIRKSISAEYEE